MADLKKVLVYFEGDDDKSFLEALRDHGKLPSNWQIAVRSKQDHPGKDGLVRQLLAFVRPVSGVGGDAVVLVDLDELTFSQRIDWFRTRLRDALGSAVPPVTLADIPIEHPRIRGFSLTANGHSGRVVLCPMGLPGDELLGSYGIDQFAIDDWLLKLCRVPAVHGAIAEFNHLAHEVVLHKFAEVPKLFRENGIEVRKSKTYVQILRAISGVAPSTATIVGRIVRKAIQTLPPEQLRHELAQLLDDLNAASALLQDTQ